MKLKKGDLVRYKASDKYFLGVGQVIHIGFFDGMEEINVYWLDTQHIYHHSATIQQLQKIDLPENSWLVSFLESQSKHLLPFEYR